MQVPALSKHGSTRTNSSAGGESASFRAHSLQVSRTQPDNTLPMAAAIRTSASMRSSVLGHAPARRSTVGHSSSQASSASSSWSRIRTRQAAAPPGGQSPQHPRGALNGIMGLRHAAELRASIQALSCSPEQSGGIGGGREASDVNVALSSSEASELPVAEVRDAYAAAEVLFQNVQVRAQIPFLFDAGSLACLQALHSHLMLWSVCALCCVGRERRKRCRAN